MKEEFFVGEEEIIEVLKRIRQCDNSSFAKYLSDEGVSLCEEAVLRNAFFNYSISAYGSWEDGEISSIVVVSMPAPTSKAQSGYLMACFLKSESDSEQSKEFVKEAFTSIISANELTKVKIKIKTDLPWWISFRELSNELHLKQEAIIPLAYGEQADLLIYSFFGEAFYDGHN